MKWAIYCGRKVISGMADYRTDMEYKDQRVKSDIRELLLADFKR